MTDFADFKAQIAEWANRQDWSYTLVTGFVRMAEQGREFLVVRDHEDKMF